MLPHYYIHYFYIIIAHYYILYYYVLLQNHYYVLLHHYYTIITLLLHHYYFIITKGKSCNNDYIITCYAKGKPLLLRHYYVLLRHYYTWFYYYSLLPITVSRNCRWILWVLVTILHDEKSFQPHRKNPELFETEYWMHYILPPACWASHVIKSLAKRKSSTIRYSTFDSLWRLIKLNLFECWTPGFSQRDMTDDFVTVFHWKATETKSFISCRLPVEQVMLSGL